MKEISLYPYQTACLEAIVSASKRGIRKQLVTLPTGAGKTVIMASLLDALSSPSALILTHRDTLLRQTVQTLRRLNPFLRVAMEQGSQRAPTNAHVVVASVNTLTQDRRLARFAPDRFATVIVDECHHVTARSYRRILDYFGAGRGSSRGQLLVGFTATPIRGDGQSLMGIFDEVVYRKTIRELIDSGYLAPLDGVRVATHVDVSGVPVVSSDFAEPCLASVVNTPARNALVCDAYRRLSPGEPAIAFCVDTAHAESLAEQARAEGLVAEAVHGHLAKPCRAERLRRFLRGETQIITNCMLLTEGFDAPHVSSILMARPTLSPVLYAQSVGRGTRRHQHKQRTLVIDLVDTSHTHATMDLNRMFSVPQRRPRRRRVAENPLQLSFDLDAQRPAERLILAQQTPVLPVEQDIPPERAQLAFL